MSKAHLADKTVLDFFAGIGLIRYALERRGWREIFALDHSPMKAAIYNHHFGDQVYHIEDVHSVQSARVPAAVLAHASFPCSNISVAGGREGLAGPESSALWGFFRVLEELTDARPPLVLLENVEGFLTSNNGNDLINVLGVLNRLGYCVDIMLIDAEHFVPQSRNRLFVVGVMTADPQSMFEQNMVLNRKTEARPKKITTFIRANSSINWYLCELPQLPIRVKTLETAIDREEPWWSEQRSHYLFNQMHDRYKAKVIGLMAQEQWTYGTAFRRMRVRNGINQSTAEVRFDRIAGCLRTPKGGSARQILVCAGFGQFNARLLNARENARLMGADDYILAPDLPLNDALFGFGDAVCVPVIEWIAQYCLEPLHAQFIQQREQILMECG